LPHERIALSLPYFLAAPWIIAGSDLVLIAPTRVARQLASLAELQSAPFPISDVGFEYRMVWHELMHRDLAHHWLRDVILKSVPS
jgi:DNA-binding transcriptional LysR family regulator